MDYHYESGRKRVPAGCIHSILCLIQSEKEYYYGLAASENAFIKMVWRWCLQQYFGSALRKWVKQEKLLISGFEGYLIFATILLLRLPVRYFKASTIIVDTFYM